VGFINNSIKSIRSQVIFLSLHTILGKIRLPPKQAKSKLFQVIGALFQNLKSACLATLDFVTVEDEKNSSKVPEAPEVIRNKINMSNI
jgi:hypothetical protein